MVENVPYRSVVGSLAYLADTTRPDIAFAVNQLARAMAAPRQTDWGRVKQVLRYLRKTTNVGIQFLKGWQGGLIGYSDSDFADDSKTSRSTTGYVMFWNDAPFHWKAKLQQHVSLSATEAEVIALWGVLWNCQARFPV